MAGADSGLETLILVDGSSLAFRSFYALLTTGLRTKTGVPTWAVMGFFNSLFDLIDRQSPHMMAVCFDTKAKTFRHESYDLYKANRDEMPDELAEQWPLIKEGVKVLDIPLLELDGYEADDIIGTVALQAAKENRRVVILTGDQDIFQLVNKTDDLINVLMPTKEGLKNFGRNEIFEKLGVWPEQIIDYKALCGDKSDNIPGIRGIGPKTASKLLADFNTLDGIYENLDSIKSKSQKTKLEEGREEAYLSQRLATISLDVPVPFNFHDCKLSLPDVDQVGSFFKSLQFKSLVARLPRAVASFAREENNKEELVGKIAEQLGGIKVEPLARDGSRNGNESGNGNGNGTSISVESEVAAPAEPFFASAPETKIIQTEEELKELITELSNSGVLSIDLETDGINSLDTNIVGWAFAWGEGYKLDENNRIEIAPGKEKEIKTAYVPVMHQVISALKQLDADYVVKELKPLLENREIGKVAQNGKFEKNVLSLYGIDLGPIVFDPMLASYIVNPDDKHGLKDQSDRILSYSMVRITEIIGKGRKQITMDQAPIETVAPYAGDDARVALALASHYLPILDEERAYLLYDMELPVEATLATMEQNGVKLDIDYLKDFSVELSKNIAEIEEKIFEISGYTFNINSTQQLQKVLFEELGLDTKSKTKTGYSTDASVLEALKDDHAIIPLLIDYRQLTKLRSTYVDALPKEVSSRDGRLHGEFNQTVASTGRLSSSNPNLQNIPIRTEVGRRIRKAFIPADESSSLLAADYSQIELRMLAHMSGDELLIDAFKQDQDIHARTAMEIFDIPLEEVDSDKRRVGKTLNFALVYQQGAFATAQDLNVSTKEAQAFIDKYFSRYPKVKAFLTGTIDDAKKNNYVTTLWGRRRYFRNLHDKNANVRRADERAACNAPIQGSAADLIKLAMIELDKKLKASGLKARLILQVHDELVLDVPDSELEETQKLVMEAMEMGQPLSVPLKVDMGTGKNWMQVK
ncbi:MAG: DNA polymerase I [Cyanobacteria bacterium HKST-UBA01]|nr:DNA polymerase I [Cyanobacteria bacterium HKST-UBA01]